jgi:hypothetical protein
MVEYFMMVNLMMVIIMISFIVCILFSNMILNDKHFKCKPVSCCQLYCLYLVAATCFCQCLGPSSGSPRRGPKHITTIK